MTLRATGSHQGGAVATGAEGHRGYSPHGGELVTNCRVALATRRRVTADGIMKLAARLQGL